MAIDLLSLQPHKVSRDLSGYIIYVYGAIKTGKTTMATEAGDALLLAFEKGYNALPGVVALDITSWKDVRDAVKDLKREEVKARFKSVIFDTVDIAGVLCEKWVCAQKGVSTIADAGAYGAGWNILKREFEDVVRQITQLGYAVFFISHDKDKEFTRKDGTKYNQIVPTCPSSFNNICKNAADIYGYAEKYQDENGAAKVRLILRSPDDSVETGCRFKYIEPIIEMGYEPLKKAINDAIDKEAKEHDGKFVTDERETITTQKTYDFEGLINEFNEITMAMMDADPAYYQPRIIDLVTRILGPGKKVNEATIQQVELIAEIVESLKDMKK
jgi:hypothetical protein